MNWIKAFLRPTSTRGEIKPEPAPYRLEDALKLHLAPVLRVDGFKGSGRTYRRTVNGMVQVLNVQGSQAGGAFAINLGLQPLALPAVLDRAFDPRKINEVDCVFRRRLSQGNAADQWWRHDSMESAATAVQAAAELYLKVGRTLLDRQSAPDAPIWTLRAEDLDDVGAGLDGFRLQSLRDGALADILARLRHASGDAASARAFAERARQQGFRSVDLAALETLVGRLPDA